MMMWQFIYNVVNGDNFIDNLFTNQVKFSKYKDSCIYHHVKLSTYAQGW